MQRQFVFKLLGFDFFVSFKRNLIDYWIFNQINVQHAVCHGQAHIGKQPRRKQRLQPSVKLFVGNNVSFANHQVRQNRFRLYTHNPADHDPGHRFFFFRGRSGAKRKKQQKNDENKQSFQKIT